MNVPSFPPTGGAPPPRSSFTLGPLDLERFISTTEVARLAGVSVSSIRHWRDEDPDFPHPRLLGDRTLRWRLREVLDWLDRRPRVDGAASLDEMDLAEREAAARRARDEAASRRLDQLLVPRPARPR